MSADRRLSSTGAMTHINKHTHTQQETTEQEGNDVTKIALPLLRTEG